MSFEKNVFINCPFDAEYSVIFRPLVFTLMYLGFNPQICTTMDSGAQRIDQIKNLIRLSKYSIHDISRNKAQKKGEWPRFNMPYELGLDIGCKTYGTGRLKEKRCLILETNRDDYDKYFSDISGQDIKAHEDDPQKLITKLHEWLDTIFDHVIPSASKINVKYQECLAAVTLVLTTNYNYSLKEINELPINSFIKAASNWIDANKFVHPN